MFKIFLVCMLAIVAGCKKRLEVAAVKSEDQKSTLFDRLIAKAPGGKVPYPFSELVAYLSQYGDPDSFLIPMSRSSQGAHASFVDPRRVVGFFTLPDKGIRERGYEEITDGIESRLFLGYVEKTKQIEVMSLNRGSTEFDFQLVENYGDNSTSRVEDANKKACLSCHQHGGPIWSEYPWSEVSKEKEIIASILTSIHKGDNVDGIKISKSYSSLYSFEGLVKYAAGNLIDNKLWHETCVTDNNAAAVCRANLLKNLSYHEEITPLTNYSVQGTFAHPRELIPDPEVVNEEFTKLSVSVDSRLKDYSVSQESSAILTKIIKQKLYQNDTQKNTPLKLIYIWLRRGSAREKALEQQLSGLSAAERSIILNEMANMLMHMYKKGKHPTPAHNPMTRRESDFNLPHYSAELGFSDQQIWLFSPHGGLSNELLKFKRYVIRVKSALPNNKSITNYITSLGPYEPLYVKLSDNKPPTPYVSDFLGTVHTSSESKAAGSVLYEEFDEEGYLLVLFNTRKVGGKPRRTSKLSYEDRYRDTEHSIDLLCRTDPRPKILYICTYWDAWQVAEVIAKMAADTSSSLHHQRLNSAVVIAELLAHLGHNVKVNNFGLD